MNNSSLQDSNTNALPTSKSTFVGSGNMKEKLKNTLLRTEKGNKRIKNKKQN